MLSLRKATESAIRALWPTIVARAGMAHRAPSLPVGSLHLLGASAKTVKGQKAQVWTGIQYLLPAGWDGTFNLCPFATQECAAACLGTESGHLGMNGGTARAAQVWRTALYLGNRALWETLMGVDLAKLGKAAAKRGMHAAARLDGSSDTGAGQLSIEGGGPYREIREAFSAHGIMGYDYTKTVARARRHDPSREENYSLALSFTGAPANAAACREYLARGGRVAVVFDGPIPVGAEFLGAEIVNGDDHDAIWLQPPGSVLGLTPKGAKAKAADCGGWKVSLQDPRILQAVASR